MIHKKTISELPLGEAITTMAEAKGQLGSDLFKELRTGENYSIRLDSAITEDPRRMCKVYELDVIAEPVRTYEFPRSIMPKQTYLPEPKTVIFHPPATIVYWEDGEKTIVKCMEGDEFNPEVGLAMCLAKYIFGKRYKKWFRDALEKGRWQDKKATKRVEDENSCDSVEQTERRIEEKAREYGDVHRAVREALKEAINKKMGMEEQG